MASNNGFTQKELLLTVLENQKEFPSWSEIAAITNPRKKRREDILINIDKRENTNAITNNTT